VLTKYLACKMSIKSFVYDLFQSISENMDYCIKIGFIISFPIFSYSFIILFHST
jgi:hypothetical protein